MLDSKNNFIIIIPTYNSEMVIRKTLESLVEQDDANFDTLIIDDNSKDKTEEIVSTFKNKLNIKFIKKPKTIAKGAAASLNYSKKYYKNKIIALIDSDTRLADNWVSIIKEILKKEQVVGAPIYAERNKYFWSYLYGLEIESRYENILEGRLKHLSTCNLALKPGLLKKIKLNEKLKYAYDHDLSFKLNKKNIFFYLTKKTSCRHANKCNLSDYFTQQFMIAKYHTVLAKKMPKQAFQGDEISPSLFVLQPFVLLFALLFIFIKPLVSLLIFLFLLLLNGYFFLYLIKKHKIKYIIPGVVLIFIRTSAWLLGFFTGILE